MKPPEYALNDPIAAIATGFVPSALGIVRTSGAGCIDLLMPIFSRPNALRAAAGYTLVHGWLMKPVENGDDADAGIESNAENTRKYQRIDEVMIAVYRAPKSFTGEDSFEITCHGGPATVLAVYRLLLSAGFRAAERGEFTFRSFANGKTDLSRAEAIREIIEAQTDTARSHAADRLSGSITEEIYAIKQLIFTALATLEVEIEYPEDEETTKGAFDTPRLEEACTRLTRLEASWQTEKMYRDGVRIVLAGKTNAGKSSLFNMLLKEDRAIVSDIHGTTRDWLEASADFNGIPVRLFDTAGLRKATDKIEAEGVERSRILASDADIVFYLVDATLGLDDDDRFFLDGRKTKENFAPVSEAEVLENDLADSKTGLPPVILLWNKADKEDALPCPGMSEFPAPHLYSICALSAKTGLGIPELIATVTGILLGPDTVSNSSAVHSANGNVGLGTEHQKRAVQHAHTAIRHAFTAASAGFPFDAIAQDLEDALDALGEITGETTPQNILDAIFSEFCVGK